MAGMEHFQNALVLAAGLATEHGTRGLENLLGHMGTGSHGQAHATTLAANAALGAPAAVAASLATWLAALDARYAAGVHAGPIISPTDAKHAVGYSAKDACLAFVRVTQTFHGTYARSLLHDTAWASACGVAVEAAIAAEIDLWLADIDARYAAGTTAAPAGAVMDGGRAACQEMATTAVSQVVVHEGYHGHEGPGSVPPGVYHGVTPLWGIVMGQALQWVAADAHDQLAFLLTKWDARYQAHA